jgi:hypothetical protein
MKKIVFIVAFIAVIAVSLYAKPVSHFELGTGPYFSSGTFEWGVEGNFTLDFWVAHVVSDLFVTVSATNNTLKITPFSSNVIQSAKFNWENLMIEYGATGTHSDLFLTTWDVGKIPSGWKNGIKVGNVKNELAIFWDRGTYDVKYVSPFFFSDAWWYENGMTLTTGISNGLFYVNAGKYNDSYFAGLGGKYGNFEAMLMGFSEDEMVFPNVEDQIPSRYVGVFKYDSTLLKALFAMSENEFYFNSSMSFNLLGANVKLWESTTYVNTVPIFMKTSGGVKITKDIGKDAAIFLDFSSKEEKTNLWLGLKWRF